MRKTRFYICKSCSDIIVSLEGKEISCCGEKLEYIEPKEAKDEEKLKVERVGDELFISTNHPLRSISTYGFNDNKKTLSRMGFRI